LTPASGAEKIFTNHLGLLDYTTSVETYNSVTQNSPNCNLLELRQAVPRSSPEGYPTAATALSRKREEARRMEQKSLRKSCKYALLAKPYVFHRFFKQKP